MPGKHAKLSPSGSKRWMSCTASPLAIQTLIEQGLLIEGKGDSVWSLEGAEAHKWAGEVLDGKKPLPINKVPEPFRPYILDYSQVCNECESGSSDGSLRLVEVEIPLFYSPDDNGTVDYAFVAVDKKGNPVKVFIRDLKYGAGVPVDAEENTQLAIYAHSLITDLATWWGVIPDHIPVSIGIHQPRYTWDDSLKLWEITVGELREFCKPIQKTAKRIDEARAVGELEFSPSRETCQFCPMKAICGARLESAFGSFPVEVMNLDLLTNMDLPEIKTTPLETLVALYAHKDAITSYLAGVEEHLSALALSGNKAPGTKLVKGRDGDRNWKDDKEAKKFLVNYIGEEKALKPEQIISPAQAEKLLAHEIDKKVLEKKMSDYTTKSEGKEVLALASNKRPEVISAMEVFSIITDDDEDA